MNHVICIPLFGKHESQELILESWNQAKIPKDSESRRREFTVADPLGFDHLTCSKGRIIDQWCCQIPTHPHPVPQRGKVGQTIDRCIIVDGSI